MRTAHVEIQVCGPDAVVTLPPAFACSSVVIETVSDDVLVVRKAGTMPAETVARDFAVSLAPEQFDAFLDALDNPPEPNDALKRLMRGTPKPGDAG